MEIREDRKYTRTHQWVMEKDGRVIVGLTDYAQASLRSIVFVNLPEVGDAVTAGEPLGEVESVKTVSEVFSPVSGYVCKVNETLTDDPSLANSTPYDAWLVEIDRVTQMTQLLSAQEYRTLFDNP